jgi:hypothetical protein
VEAQVALTNSRASGGARSSFVCGYNREMGTDRATDPQPPDDGLRRVLTWTFTALVISVLMAVVGVALAVHFFDRP